MPILSMSSPIPTVPINDLQRSYAVNRDSILQSVSDTLASGWWLNGQQGSSFCEEFANYLGAARCIGVANGTDALEISIRALLSARAIQKHEVVTVANAGGYSTIACRLVGLTPVYADIEEASQLASLDSIVSALNDDTALVISTHLYGGMVDIPRLRAMMANAGYAHVPILEDCAQAHGLSGGGRMAGSFGDAAAFSFYPTKNLGAAGDGGAIVTSDHGIADACEALKQYGWTSKYTVTLPDGRNSRLDEVQAAVLRVFLPGLDEANARRQEILKSYEDAAPSGIRVVRSAQGTVAHLAVVLCDDRERLKQHMTKHGIATEIHYPVLDSDQPGWQGLAQRQALGDLKIARKSIARILTLPCFPTMTVSEQQQVCEALASWTS